MHCSIAVLFEDAVPTAKVTRCQVITHVLCDEEM
jgi:hypothetical protein